jgi:alkylhydroperoxidase family enzyme
VYLEEPPASAKSQDAYQADLDEDGFVWGITKLWAWNPEGRDLKNALLGQLTEHARLTFRDRGILISSMAAAVDNSGCALAWGNRLATAAGVDTAVGVLRGEEPAAMSDRDRALSRWARKVAADPVSTTQADVDELRDAGFSESEIFSITFFVAMRIAFSAVNDALGTPLDLRLVETYPEEVVAAVDFGRPSA